MFGLRILQTLHQGDGRVLHKLHQQLRGEINSECHHVKLISYYFYVPFHPYNVALKIKHENVLRLAYLWFGVKLIRKHESPCVESARQHDNTAPSNSPPLATTCSHLMKTKMYLELDVLNVRFSVGHRIGLQVIFESSPLLQLFSQTTIQNVTSILSERLSFAN